MRYGFHPLAETELNEAADWYERQAEGLGGDFAREFRLALARLLETPDRWRQVEPGIQRCLLKRFPYGIIYLLRENELHIVAVAHLHREPGYWKRRLD